MTICVLTDMSGATKRTVTSSEIKADVARLNAATGRIWEVEQTTLRKTRFLRRSTEMTPRYSLYLDCHGEWQLINFPPMTEGGWSICTDVDYRTLMTMLHWYLLGLDQAKALSPNAKGET